MATGMEDLKVLRTAEMIADDVWRQVTTLDVFAREVVGGQLARAADSVGANIAEAFGRFHYGDKIRHLYIARGSLFETKYWLNRCEIRHLLAVDQVKDFGNRLTDVARQLNALANYLKHQRQADQPRAVRELSGSYDTEFELVNPLFSEEDLVQLQSPIANP